MMKQKILDMSGIKKYIFDISGKPIRGTDVLILDNVWFDLYEGEVNVLLGENGAGKSTLMKILAGEIPHDAGKMIISGKEQHFGNPKEARACGVTFIHQELNLCTNLTVAQNIFMGKEYTRASIVDNRRMIVESQALIDSLGFSIDVRTRVDRLSTAQQQVVEIAKALSYDSKILIMDEPTASLTSQEISQLFDLVRKMRDRGMGIVFISHRMDEVEQIADRVTVMKDGQTVGVMTRNEFTPDEAVKMMVGRTLMQIYSTTHIPSNERVFEVRNFRVGRGTKPFDLYLKKGEILGIGGLVGAGRTEFAQGVFGARECHGEVYLKGKRLDKRSPRKCIRKGMIYLSEDRKVEGLILPMKIQENIASTALKKICGRCFLSARSETALAQSMIEKFSIVCRNSVQSVGTLSGGNQQKVCFAKCYAAEPDVFILDEPTRGVDVNAKAQIYKMMDALTNAGKSIIMITSEMNELIGMSDRIYIMRDGCAVAEISDKHEITDENILQYTIGLK